MTAQRSQPTSGAPCSCDWSTGECQGPMGCKAITDFAGTLVRLRTQLAEHESNQRTYEEIIGKKTYREVADELASARKALEDLENLAQFLVDRLEEFDPGDDQPEREFHGHVAPAAARLRDFLSHRSAKT